MSVYATLYRVIDESVAKKMKKKEVEYFNLIMTEPFLCDEQGIVSSPFVKARFYSKFHKLIAYKKEWFPDLYKLEKMCNSPVMPDDYCLIPKIGYPYDINPNHISVYISAGGYILPDHLSDIVNKNEQLSEQKIIIKDFSLQNDKEFKSTHYEMKVPVLYCYSVKDEHKINREDFPKDMPKWLDGCNYLLNTKEIKVYLRYLGEQETYISKFLDGILEDGGLKEDEFIEIWK